MPVSARTIANQVLARIRSPITTQARHAASSGDRLATSSVLAVVVRVSASAKQVNITAHIAPESRPGSPIARTGANARRPCRHHKVAATAAMQNRLRQKVISKPPAASSCRTNTPAMLQQVAQKHNSATARR